MPRGTFYIYFWIPDVEAVRFFDEGSSVDGHELRLL